MKKVHLGGTSGVAAIEDIELIVGSDRIKLTDGKRYAKVEEADGDDNNPYYYISSIEETGGDLSAMVSFGEIKRPAGGYPDEYIGKTVYIYNEGSMPYVYDPE